MQRRRFSREFKVEMVRLVTDRGVSIAQATRDVLRKRVKEFEADQAHYRLLELWNLLQVTPGYLG